MGSSYQTLPLEGHIRWVWDSSTESWLCGEPTDGAGVFHEDGDRPGVPIGWYFGLIIEGYIHDISSGPYASKEEAMNVASGRFIRFKSKLGGDDTISWSNYA
jgi:hypothetical protein